VIVAGSQSSNTVIAFRCEATPFVVSGAKSTRLIRYASAHCPKVLVTGLSVIARSATAGFVPAAISPATKFRRAFASFNVRNDPACTIG
jgi:hypothetical protein